MIGENVSPTGVLGPEDCRVVLSISTVSLCIYYRLQTSIVYGNYRTMKDPVRQDLARMIRTIVNACPELSIPRYVPTPWAANRWLNIALLLFKES